MSTKFNTKTPVSLVCFLLCISLCSAEINENCIGAHFGPCNENSKRDIIFYKLLNSNPECENVQVPSIVRNKSCNLKCPAGSKITYDIDRDSLECVECPENTYSTGGNFYIDGEKSSWTPEKLKLFNSRCMVYFNQTVSEDNVNCTSFNITADNTMLMSGTTIKEGSVYIGELYWSVNLKEDGTFFIRYKKDTIVENFVRNGNFKIFIDYSNVLFTDEPNSDWQEFSIQLTQGDHDILLTYTYSQDENSSASKNLFLRIDQVNITGIENASYECIKCVDSVSKKGSSACSHCNVNQFYDTVNEKCEDCPEGTYSFANSVGADKCKQKVPCNEYDYITVMDNECIDGKRKVTYVLRDQAQCTEVNPLQDEEIMCDPCNDSIYGCNCPLGMYTSKETDFKCAECEEGKFASVTLEINKYAQDRKWFTNTCKSSTIPCKEGWKFSKDKIYTGNYLSEDKIEMVLYTDFFITQREGYLAYDVEVENLLENEKFFVKVNNITETIITGDLDENGKKMSYNLTLSSGYNEVSFSYLRVKSKNVKNALIIRNLRIVGTNKGKSSTCLSCPEGMIRQRGSKDCTLCPAGYTSNKEGTRCERCDIGLITKGDEFGQTCVGCPDFTLSDEFGTKCTIVNVLQNDNGKLKFNLQPLKEMVSEICSQKSGMLCYNDKFIGPATLAAGMQNNLYFLSIFERDTINITDFSYFKNTERPGHIFALFNRNGVEVSKHNEPYFKHSIVYTNFKTFKNIGAEISKVTLVPSYGDNKPGIIINYDNGDQCLNAPSRKYSTILILKCDKSKGGNAPKLIKTLDMGCTFVFEWTTKYACKNCITSEVEKQLEGRCVNGTRTISPIENEDCLIFSAAPVKSYNDSSGILEESSNLYEILYGKSKIPLDSNSTSVCLDCAEYIDQLFTTESCNFMENVDNDLMWIVILIPIVYVLTIVSLVLYYCKYRKIKNNYERLRGNEGGSMSAREIDKNNKRQLEMN